jgi:hypothetical protein
MDKEDYTYVVKEGNFDFVKREFKTPNIEKHHKAFVKRAIAINCTNATKCIRIGVVGFNSKFIQLRECKNLEISIPCEVEDIHLLEYECIAARFEGSQLSEDLILRVEGEQWDSKSKDTA